MHVGDDATLGAQVAGDHLGGVERCVADLAEVRIRLVGRIAVVAIVGTLAATEVLVDPGAGESVEAFDGRGQGVDGQPGLGRQLGEGVGFHDHPGFHPLVRNPLSRLQTGEDVAVTVLLIEDQPRRDVLTRSLALAILSAVHVMARFHIRHRLVHEPFAVHVDDDRAGGVAFGQGEPRGAHEWDCRAPPRVFHDIQGGAELFGGENAVAGVGDGAHRPLGGDGGALVLDPHLLVVLETATTQDHPPPGPDQRRLGTFGFSGVANIDAPNHTALDVEVGHRGVESHWHPGLLQADA